MSAGSLARLFSALSAECDDLSLRVEDLHELLAGAGPSGGHARFLTGAQDIDYIQQHLASLAQFLMELSEWTPTDIPVEMEGPLLGIRLSALRARLAGGQPVDDGPVVRSGELELL